jgi:hypothetical protein
MTNINIEIPDELHKKIRIESAKKETTIKQLIIKILEKNSK